MRGASQPAIVVAVVGLAIAAGAARAADAPRAYRYEAEEAPNIGTKSAHRIDFALERGRDGALDAVVLAGATQEGGGDWKPMAPGEDCRRAMRAPPGALAKVRIWPASGGDDPLGAGFLDACAPPDLFYSLTDVVNVAIIPIAPQFRAAGLRKPGQSRRWPGFKAHFARYGRSFDETVTGGETALVSRAAGEAVVDWKPDQAQLEIDQAGPPQARLQGAERWAFRVRFDPRSRMLRSAEATTDEIELNVHVPPDKPDPVARVVVKRRVAIAPLAAP
jgi:hypothetical protein